MIACQMHKPAPLGGTLMHTLLYVDAELKQLMQSINNVTRGFNAILM